jgi:hypothetical protein
LKRDLRFRTRVVFTIRMSVRDARVRDMSVAASVRARRLVLFQRGWIYNPCWVDMARELFRPSSDGHLIGAGGLLWGICHEQFKGRGVQFASAMEAKGLKAADPHLLYFNVALLI